jgi:hypothetical protein
VIQAPALHGVDGTRERNRRFCAACSLDLIRSRSRKISQRNSVTKVYVSRGNELVSTHGMGGSGKFGPTQEKAKDPCRSWMLLSGSVFSRRNPQGSRELEFKFDVTYALPVEQESLSRGCISWCPHIVQSACTSSRCRQGHRPRLGLEDTAILGHRVAHPRPSDRASLFRNLLPGILSGLVHRLARMDSGRDILGVRFKQLAECEPSFCPRQATCSVDPATNFKSAFFTSWP